MLSVSRRTVLVTGGTSGLGLELVRTLSERGYRIIATGRNNSDQKQPSENVEFIRTDFSRLQEVRKLVILLKEKELLPDIIVNNAGILPPPEYRLTEDGFETGFQVNFLSHLVLNDLLVDAAEPSREIFIISVTSPVYRIADPLFRIPDEDSYSIFKSYACSKYYLLLIGGYLNKKYPGRNIRFIGFDPGTFRSGIYRMQKRWFHSMYAVAAPFMRDPWKIATEIAGLAINEVNEPAVYRFGSKKLYPLPGFDDRAESLFLSCKAAVDIMR